MKDFEYAQTKKKAFKIPTIKTTNYNIPLWALPFAPFAIIYDKIDKWNYAHQTWDEKKATKVLDYFLPYALEYDEESQAYYYCMDWIYSGSDMAKRVPIGLKKWTKIFSYKILDYLKNTYEKTGFIKSIEEDCSCGYLWIKFKKSIDN